MAEAAVSILLGSLSELELYHGDLINGAEKELQQLKNDLALLKAFLQDEANTPAGESDLPKIKESIKKVVYEVEDTIESCLNQAMTAPRIGKKFLSRHFSVKNVAKEVKSLRENKVKGLLNDIKDYNSISKASNGTTTRRRSRLTAVRAIGNDRVVGLDEEQSTIIGYLEEEKQNLDVISIIGKVGVGKTTLARKIFESERVASLFRTRIWVHLSRNFKIMDVFLSILKSFTSHDMSSLTKTELIDTLRALLKKEKFLLVLDNVCSSEAWNEMQQILSDSIGMGKILITSRENHVSGTKTCELGLLSKEESWELLQLQVFGKSGGCPQVLENIGRSIADRCQLPLQIVTVGRILSDQLNEKEWRNVLENIEKGITNMIEFSYSELPDELKECFLYMGVFPKDSEISVWKLTRLWVAEGFVKQTEGKSMEEAADNNLAHLIRRNLVMADKLNFNGEVKTCRLHDMIHDFCLDKAKDLNFFQEIKDSGEVEQNPPRLFTHYHPSTVLSGNPNGLQTRSFLCFYEPPELKQEYVPVITTSFPNLRILAANSINFKEFPAKVTKLLHLRYLTLRIDALKKLPESLSSLWNLQTLVIDTTSPSIEMKTNIWKMIQLRHLRTGAAIYLSSKGEGDTVAGEKLQTLDKLSPRSCTEDLFKRTSKLKTLVIRGKLDTHSGQMFLELLNSLEKLKLVNDLGDEKASDNLLARVLQPHRLPPYLKRLTLSNTFLEWDHIATLATIKSLEVLKLKSYACIGSKWSTAEDGFPNLQLLLIFAADLVEWVTPANCFPSLRCLVLKECEKLDQIPNAIAETLEVLDIDYVSKSVVESARKFEEGKKQVQEPFKLSIGRGCNC